jgi:hypothetical protein
MEDSSSKDVIIELPTTNKSNENNENKERNEKKERNKQNVLKVVNMVGEMKLNQNNIIQNLHSVMESVEIVDKTIKGSDKKILALEVLDVIIDNNSELSIEDKVLLKALVKQIAPQAIEVIIKVGNGLSHLVSKVSSNLCWCF